MCHKIKPNKTKPIGLELGSLCQFSSTVTVIGALRKLRLTVSVNFS